MLHSPRRSRSVQPLRADFVGNAERHVGRQEEKDLVV
jgi:hypothetical protein